MYFFEVKFLFFFNPILLHLRIRVVSQGFVRQHTKVKTTCRLCFVYLTFTCEVSIQNSNEISQAAAGQMQVLVILINSFS